MRVAAAAALTLSVSALALWAARETGAVPDVEWTEYGGDSGHAMYAPIEEITKDNVQRLRVEWEWKTGEESLPEWGVTPGAFQDTPLMINGLLFCVTPYNRVVALDAWSGRVVWTFDPEAYKKGQPLSVMGFHHRGLAAAITAAGLTLFHASRTRLFAIRAASGRLVSTFGDHGSVDLTEGVDEQVAASFVTRTSPPTVFRHLVIVGNGVPDGLSSPNDASGDVRAFEIETGREVWRFRTIADVGMAPNAWPSPESRHTGHVNVWAPMSLDRERGLLFLPVSAPSDDHYGGRRKGSNLYADSLVCLDAMSGVMRWYFQFVHHDLWDYDPPAPPNLVEVDRAGVTIPAVVQFTKQGFAFFFQRETGAPIWPIEEVAVPRVSDVGGEQPWPTQPVPTRPAPLEAQGIGPEDAIDFTPYLNAVARSYMNRFKAGPLFTPPSVGGTLQRPGVRGAVNWGGAAYDSQRHLLFVKVSRFVSLTRVTNTRQTSVVGRSIPDNVRRGESDNSDALLASGVPLDRPPYGSLVAIASDTGDALWRVPAGRGVVRDALKSHVAVLPERLGTPGPAGPLLTAGGVILLGTEDGYLYAFDRDTGRELANIAVGGPVISNPMSYRTRGRQMIVVAVGRGVTAHLSALRLG